MNAPYRRELGPRAQGRVASAGTSGTRSITRASQQGGAGKIAAKIFSINVPRDQGTGHPMQAGALRSVAFHRVAGRTNLKVSLYYSADELGRDSRKIEILL